MATTSTTQDLKAPPPIAPDAREDSAALFDLAGVQSEKAQFAAALVDIENAIIRMPRTEANAGEIGLLESARDDARCMYARLCHAFESARSGQCSPEQLRQLHVAFTQALTTTRKELAVIQHDEFYAAAQTTMVHTAIITHLDQEDQKQVHESLLSSIAAHIKPPQLPQLPHFCIPVAGISIKLPVIPGAMAGHKLSVIPLGLPTAAAHPLAKHGVTHTKQTGGKPIQIDPAALTAALDHLAHLPMKPAGEGKGDHSASPPVIIATVPLYLATLSNQAWDLQGQEADDIGAVALSGLAGMPAPYAGV